MVEQPSANGRTTRSELALSRLVDLKTVRAAQEGSALRNAPVNGVVKST
jgi:hypothetical protein